MHVERFSCYIKDSDKFHINVNLPYHLVELLIPTYFISAHASTFPSLVPWLASGENAILIIHSLGLPSAMHSEGHPPPRAPEPEASSEG
jgi:hypothetical protein